jgi:hypothetical protein
MSNDPRIRTETAKRILSTYWPDHYTIWINGVEDYNKINWLMSHKDKTDVIICQTEEDWFYHIPLEHMRKRIASDKNWTTNSFLITNSRKDYEVSKDYLNVKFRPGILDLISYHTYDKQNISLTVEDIKFHTAYFYDFKRFGRPYVTKSLLKEIDKVAILKTPSHSVTNLDVSNIESEVFFTAKQDAPNVFIDQDYSYSKHCAFSIAFETFNGLPNSCSTHNGYKEYSPTLSEKTYKSMHLLRPCLVFGGHNTRQYLKDLGFDTWDWLIDWTFDSEQDPIKRLLKYCEELERLLAIDIDVLKNLIDKNQSTLFHNRDRVFSLIENYGKDIF